MNMTALSPKPAGSQILSISGSSANASMGNVGVVRLVTSADCFIKFGSSAPTASSTLDMFLPAGMPEYFDVSQFFGSGAVFVAAITSGGTGSLYITNCN